MRLWSLHPRYLDTKGLLALWREGLLAQAVLKGATKGYKNHPQLTRFRSVENPLEAINLYLSIVLEESQARGYRFDASKVPVIQERISIPVTAGQVQYEIQHLKNKLMLRDAARLKLLPTQTPVDIHPIFFEVVGPVEPWEVVSQA